MTDRELLQMALDALEYYHSGEDYFPTPASKLIAPLRARLAQPEQKETPYLIGARLFREGKGISFIPTAVPTDADIGEALQGWEDAKTAEEIAQPESEPEMWVHDKRGWVGLHEQPQRKWVGLTDEELKAAIAEKSITPLFSYRMVGRAIEAKLKEKNGYAEN